MLLDLLSAEPYRGLDKPASSLMVRQKSFIDHLRFFLSYYLLKYEIPSMSEGLSKRRSWAASFGIGIQALKRRQR